MRFSSSKSTSYHGRGTSAMTLRPHAVHTYHEDEEEPTLSLGRLLVLAAPWILVAVAAYFSIHDCAVGGAMGGRYRDCRCRGFEWLVFDRTAADGPRRTVCLGFVAERTCYRHREGPVMPCTSRAER